MRLALGSAGADVRQLQDALNKLGKTKLQPLQPDGQFGQKTRGRVMEFQGNNGLGVDGVVGQFTMGVIQEALRLLGLIVPPGPTSDITVRSINQEILGMDGPNHLIPQIIPSIGIVNPGSFRAGIKNNALTFSSTAPSAGRLSIFAATKGNETRAVILLLPLTGIPDRTIICITQGFAQATKDLDPLGWSNPLSPPFVKFCLLKHVINRWGAQTLASRKQMAFVYIVRAKGKELGPFAKDGAFMAEVLKQMSASTGNSFGFDHVEAFTFSSGVSEFNTFIGAVAPVLPVEMVYGIDPAQAMSLARPPNAGRKQFLSGQTGGPAPGFEFLGLDSWKNEFQFPSRTKFKNPWPFNYLHNHTMPLYILNLALQT